MARRPSSHQCQLALRPLRQKLQRLARPNRPIPFPKRYSLRRVLAPLPSRNIRNHLPPRVCPSDLYHRPHRSLSRPHPPQRCQEYQDRRRRCSCKVDEALSGSAGLVVCRLFDGFLCYGDHHGGGVAYGNACLGVDSCAGIADYLYSADSVYLCCYGTGGTFPLFS